MARPGVYTIDGLDIASLAPTRADAKDRGERYYRSPSACEFGEMLARRVSDGNCLCRKCADKRRQSCAESRARWVATNADRIHELKRSWADGNREQTRAKNARYKRENKAKVLADTRYRQTTKLNATPAWVNRKEIEAIYIECRNVSAATGIKHHVDHIEPLRGKDACGLHVPWNLQILPAEQNYKKGNRRIEMKSENQNAARWG